MKPFARWVLMPGLFLGLLACTEKPQMSGSATKKSELAAYTGTVDANKAYVADGWAVGDKASWEQQMRVRGLNQNEYQRVQ